MRLRLLRRRLTISAPRMAVRSAMPWPLRWLFLAVVFGFCAAVGLWAFEFGRSLAGLEGVSREELVRLRAEVDRLREESQQLQAVTNTSDSLLVAERTAMQQLMARLRQAEAESAALREDLGFFEKLLPANAGSHGVAIRGLQAEMLADAHLRWQVLVMRQAKNLLELQPKARITGNVNYRALEMHQGATIAGQLQPAAVLIEEKPPLKLASNNSELSAWGCCSTIPCKF
jgi:hypothetical protein